MGVTIINPFVSFPASGAWTPADLPNLALWLDASDVETFTFGTGSRVATWADKSGNGRDFTQATAESRPNRTGTQNSLSTVVFTHPEHMTGTTFGPSTSTFTICGVAAPTAAAIRVYFSLGSDNHAAISHRGLGNSYGGLIGGVAWLTTSTTGDTSGFSIGLVRRSGGTNTVRRNATDLTVTDGGSSTPLSASGSMWLGGDNAEKVAVDIAEIIVLDGTSVSGTDLTSLETYLNDKWAVY
jgi:hypothetical protein